MSFHTIPRIGWLDKLLIAGFLFTLAGHTFAAGYERLEAPASNGEPAIEAMVWTPCTHDAELMQFGPYVVQGTRNCPVLGHVLPLVVISHGQGGTLLGHNDLAVALADAGFVVVTFNHPGDSFGDDFATQQLSIFESRPRDVSRVISFMLDNWSLHRRLDAEAIGVFGFSRGGYTALALAGAIPSLSASAKRLCGHWWSFTKSLCRQIWSNEAHLSPQADPRIRAIVIADPLNLFDKAGLQTVRIPVQLWASKNGGEGVALTDIEAIRSTLPRPPEYHIVWSAGHFAFLAPCTPALKESAERICEDPEGFDRPSFHRTMNAAVIRFFRENLQSGPHK